MLLPTVYIVNYMYYCCVFFFFFSSRRRHTRCLSDWISDVSSSDLFPGDIRAATTDHEHGIADFDFGVIAAGRADRTELLGRAEDAAKESVEGGDIVDDGIRGDGLCFHNPKNGS